MSIIQPVILSGGSGTRLWPLSRESYPKQFLPLASELTMLQATWQRVAPIAAHGPLVIANEEHRFVAARWPAASSARWPTAGTAWGRTRA
ncbi:sugar phosphate nucleotidyltransferase, partial [Stenotrophomonas geniculata]